MSQETIDPRFAIGVTEMDHEHAHWIALIEKFRATASGHLSDRIGIDAARQALQHLADYTKTHFASEERLLKACKYPALAEHQQKHRELTAAVARLAEEISQRKTDTTPLKLNLLVTVWLLEHIMAEDRKYARHIIAYRAKA